jgi:hypothetical protein
VPGHEARGAQPPSSVIRRPQPRDLTFSCSRPDAGWRTHPRDTRCGRR